MLRNGDFMIFSKNFSTQRSSRHTAALRWLYALLSVILWILIWHITAVNIDNSLFLPAPAKVLEGFMSLIKEDSFRSTVKYSFLNITEGFFLAVSIGTVLACLSAIHPFIRSFINFPMKIIKATPVASFTILALLWISSNKLSVLISFLMGLPIIYTNVLQGIDSTDKKQLEMSRVFRFGIIRLARYIYAANIAPYFISACSITAGMCWKSGIAAEVIGITRNSIGNQLYQAKLYLEIPRLFAYTAVIIVISIIFEKLALFAFNILAGIVTHSAYLSHTAFAVKRIFTGLCKKKPPVPPCRIDLSGISKTYGGNKVLDNLNLTLNAGKTTAVMAPSGTGKTTLAYIIAGLSDADSGSVSFSEKPYISMVFQEDRLLGHSDVATNLLHGDASVIDGDLRAIGLEHALFYKISALSGGMKRRVAILRCLLQPANVIILDEPFKGLDSGLKKDVMNFVKKRTAGKTVLLITHDIKEANFFTDTIVTLRQP